MVQEIFFNDYNFNLITFKEKLDFVSLQPRISYLVVIYSSGKMAGSFIFLMFWKKEEKETVIKDVFFKLESQISFLKSSYPDIHKSFSVKIMGDFFLLR